MPELDKNYIAGLYLDEITLDVMPQEYIDAALEVKLRYDACAPRAGYNCVQDRRVKGGFYYRKAPQGQGVNALPPSKLERALARSQEQPTQRSGLSFLSKAAIGAGVAIGGLALTGAVVNAGRSSEPYQEPVRQKPDPVKTHFNATTIGLAAVIGLSKKTEPQKTEETIKPEESAKAETPKTPEEAQKKEGADAAGYDIAAIKEMTSSPISSSAIAYENALAIKYSKEGGLAQGREKASLYAPEGDENFVRLSDVQYSAEKKEPTKASRAKTSADLQKTYDKLKEYGLEDSIEFRKARSKARGKEGTELNTVSANPYSITRDGVTENVGEMRFMRSPKDIQKAIAEKLKSPAKPKVQPSKSPSSADLPMYSGSQGQKIAIPEGANFTGWKLHLNFGNGGENVTQEAYDKLTALGVPFKVGKSGSQTGKDATVYVGDPKKAKAIAAELSQLKGLKPLKGTDAEGNDIELAPGIGARFNVGAGNPEFQQYGRKGGVDLVDDVQNRIFDPNKNKSEAEINAGLQKDWENGDKALRAKFGDLYAGMMDSPKVEDPASSPAEKPNTAPAYIASKVSTLYGGQNTTRNGFEELDAIRGKKTLGAYSDEEIDNAIASSPIQKMQVKGKTYIRDLDKVDEGVLLNEAVNLRKASSKVNTIKAPEVRRLLEARDHKAANLSKKKDPTPEEKEAFSKLDKAVEEMRTAIGDREKNPVRSERVRPEKKPQAEDLGGDSGEGGGKNVRGESSKVKKAAADRAKQQETPDIEPPVVARSEEQIAADRVATERANQAKDQEAKQSKREGMAALAETRLTEKGIELSIKKQQKQIDGDEFNVEVEKLRQNPATVRAVEKAIEPIANEYDDRIAQVSNKAKRKSLEKEKAAKVEEQTLETYRGLQIPDPLQVKPPAPTAEKAALDKKATNKGIPVTPPLAPNLSVENVDFKEPEYRGKEISNLSEAITKAKGSIPILVSQKDPIRYEAQGEISNLITYGASMAKDRDNETVRAFPYVLPKDKDIADAMLRQQDILYREPSDITPALSQSKIRGQASLTSSLDLENLVPTKSIDRYDPKTIESLAQDFTKVGGTIKPIVTIQKDPLSHEIVDGHLQYYAAKKAAEINPQYANIRSYPAEDMNHAEAIVAQYEAVRKAIAETDAVKAAVAPKAVRSQFIGDLAKIADTYNSRIKDAENIGDKTLRANALRNAYDDKERAIAALSNPPESPAPVDSQSSTSKASTSEKKPRSPSNKPAKERPSAETPPAKKKEPAAKKMNPAPERPIDLNTLQSNIGIMEVATQRLESSLGRIRMGEGIDKGIESSLESTEIDIRNFKSLGLEKQISKLEKEIAYQRGLIEEKKKEGLDLVAKLQLSGVDVPAPAIPEKPKSIGVSKSADFNNSVRGLKTVNGDNLDEVLTYFDSTRLSESDRRSAQEEWKKSPEVRQALELQAKDIEEINKFLKEGSGLRSTSEISQLYRRVYRTFATLREKEQSYLSLGDEEAARKTIESILPKKTSAVAARLAQNVLIDDSAPDSTISKQFITETLADGFTIFQSKNNKTLKRIVREGNRGSADPRQGFINIGAQKGVERTRTLLFHEMGHHIEYSNPAILKEATEFRLRRASSEVPVSRQSLIGVPIAGQPELVYPDDFISDYVGRDYGKKAKSTEVISVGFEHFSNPERLLRLMANDREHFLLMMKVMR